MAEDLIRYDLRVRRAMRGVVRDTLREASLQGIPGDHHFYITFDTAFQGVDMPGDLRAAHPNGMTVVVQHQYRDLHVTDGAFSVVLFFGGVPRRLTVPFDAILRFQDPSVAFEMRFAPEPVPQGARMRPVTGDAAGTGAEVVSLDAFRKRS